MSLFPERNGFLNYIINLLGVTVLYEAYIIITTKFWGGTLGKVYFNVVILSVKAETKITWVQAILRELINIVLSLTSLIPLLIFISLSSFQYDLYQRYLIDSNFGNISALATLAIFGLEIVTSLASEKRRAIHDILAGTVVKKFGQYRKFSRVVALVCCTLALIVITVLLSKIA